MSETTKEEETSKKPEDETGEELLLTESHDGDSLDLEIER